MPRRAPPPSPGETTQAIGTSRTGIGPRIIDDPRRLVRSSTAKGHMAFTAKTGPLGRLDPDRSQRSQGTIRAIIPTPIPHRRRAQRTEERRPQVTAPGTALDPPERRGRRGRRGREPRRCPEVLDGIPALRAALPMGRLPPPVVGLGVSRATGRPRTVASESRSGRVTWSLRPPRGRRERERPPPLILPQISPPEAHAAPRRSRRPASRLSAIPPAGPRARRPKGARPNRRRAEPGGSPPAPWKAGGAIPAPRPPRVTPSRRAPPARPPGAPVPPWESLSTLSYAERVPAPFAGQ